MKINTLVCHCSIGAMIALSTSCTKIDKDMESVTVAHGDTLKYSLGGFGDEEGATIEKQPQHAQFSDLDRRGDSGEMIYLYVAESDYLGADYVELRSARGSDGASKNRDVIITKLNIEVTE
ncbi:hypothetical protein [uncultured Imperialibacter sp.]|uniref:hypothetical protein n=1 Tax=uncultured Imperialibacter sp. TaxID=1672639 RepID=UPI0030D7CC17|tara:strand:+ start:2988 stop:3350 length:363 start_codon:yes stop_codon:yes gene_type:complete